MAPEGTGGPIDDSVLVRLALASTTLHPDDLADLVADEVARAGLGEAAVYLVCLEQRTLRRLGPHREGNEPAEVEVGESAAGLAYRRERPVVEGGEGGGFCAWYPLMDSAERIGVISVRTDVEPDRDRLTLCQAVANFAAELVANKRAYGDRFASVQRVRPLSIAAELRWSMLPPLTFSGQNMTITGIVAPAYEIAGDTFDYAVNGDVAHITILDAVGHGLEAARIADLAIGVHRNSRRCGMSPVETYQAMNDAVEKEFGHEKFATAQIATADLSTGELSWVNAGHPAPMVVRDGRRVDLRTNVWLPVGLADPRLGPTRVSEAQLEPGDLVVFFTDGVVEARSPSGAEFGRKRLGNVLEAAARKGEKPAETLRLAAQELFSHQGETLHDDATLLLLAWDGPPA
jgi:hypothetical protein